MKIPTTRRPTRHSSLLYLFSFLLIFAFAGLHVGLDALQLLLRLHVSLSGGGAEPLDGLLVGLLHPSARGV